MLREDALLPPAGLGRAEVEKLLLSRRGSQLPQTLTDEFGADERRARFWETEADLFVAAAASGTLDVARLDQLETACVSAIVCGANHPFHAERPGDTRIERDANERARRRSSQRSCSAIRHTVGEGIDEAVRRAGSTDRGLLAGGVRSGAGSCRGVGAGEL